MTRRPLFASLIVVLLFAASCAGQSEHAHSTAPGAAAPAHRGRRRPRWWSPATLEESRELFAPGHHGLVAVPGVFRPGPRLTYGFNHWEAPRSFREAARVDPACAMCQWGIALT